jgi:tetratricopeptide (TPR) repeat protein
MVTIYVASTNREINEFQQAILEKLPETGFLQCVISSDLNFAYPDSLEEVKRRIVESDLFLAIISCSRGTEIVGEPFHRSLTELEYDLAREEGKICLILLQPQPNEYTDKKAEETPFKRQISFRQRVEQQRVISRNFTSPMELAAEVATFTQQQLGKLFLRAGQLSLAKEAFEAQLILARQSDDGISEAAALDGLGDVAAGRSDMVLAEAQYRQSLEIYQQLNWRPGLAVEHHNLARAYRDLGQLIPAAQAANTALTLHQELGDAAGTAACLSTLAIIGQKRGMVNEAVQLHAEAIKLMTQIGDREGAGRENANLAMIYIDSARQLWSLEEQYAHDPVSAQHYARQKLQQLEEAERRLQEASAIAAEQGCQQDRAVVLGNLSLVHRLRGDLPQAEAFARRSLTIYEEIGDRGGMASAWTNIGVVYLDTNDLKRAFEALQQAQQIAEAIQHIDHLGEILKDLGILFARANDFGRACQYWKQAKQYFLRLQNKDELAFIEECLQSAGCGS